MQRRKFILTAFASLSGLFASRLCSAAPPTATSDSETMFTQLMKIMDQIGIIIPGQGFKSIKLGDPVEKLIRLLGPPNRISEQGVASYLLSNKTVIHFSGDDAIRTIAVQGQIGSLAHVNNGVRFGMSVEQLISQANGAPDNPRANPIRYADQGIEYWFKDGVLAQIKVYPPREKRPQDEIDSLPLEPMPVPDNS